MKFFINFLTISRILLGPIIFILILYWEAFMASLLLFLFASISDYFDGALARKYDLSSSLGEVLDPIADKILIVFVLFGLAVNLNSYLIAFIGALIIAREIWVGALRDLNARNNRSNATKVTLLAKIKTTMQLFTISIYLLGLTLNNMLVLVIGDILLFISLFITLYTGLIYTLGSFKANKDN